MSVKDDKSSSHNEKVHDHDDPESPALPSILKDEERRAGLDVTLVLPGMTGVHDEDELHTAEARAVKKKLDWRILPLLFS
jgi:hypothetical protein